MKKLFVLLLILTLLLAAGCKKTEQTQNTEAQQTAQKGGTQSGQNAQAQTPKDAAALRSIIYEHAGVAEADVYDIDEEWETRNNTKVYELDFDAFGVEYEYAVDAYTGKILSYTSEGTPEYPDESLNKQLTEEEAKDIALTHAGAAEADVTGLRIELDREDQVYEIEFRYDGLEYEYQIDLYAGQIVEFDKDRD